MAMADEYVYKIASRYLQKWLSYDIKHVEIAVRPVAQLVEHRTPNLLPVWARVPDASVFDI